ncbi:MAG: PaaI family thioesterase [Rubrobacteraceae bacterium]
MPRYHLKRTLRPRGAGDIETQFKPADEDFARKVREGFERQTFMKTIGAELREVGPGYCEIHLRFREELCQHDGYLHAGVTSTIADNAAGFAAYTLMPAGSQVLSVEFKMNLLRPAVGEKLIARARVQKPGRNISVVQAEVSAVNDGEEKTVAIMLATMACLPGEPDAGNEPGG